MSGRLVNNSIPCTAERKESLACVEKHIANEQKDNICREFYEKYKACKKEVVHQRNLKNNRGYKQTFFSFSKQVKEESYKDTN